MTDIVFDTVNLPDAVVGTAYEASIAYHGAASVISASSVSTGHLPAGLTLDLTPKFTRITGTPTGAANATPQSGSGVYSFKLTFTDSGGAVAMTTAVTINLRTAGFVDDVQNNGLSVNAKVARLSGI